MTLTGERAAAALRALGLGEVDSITELDARGDEGWEDVVGPVRTEVANAYEADRFATEEPSDIVREIGYGLVPSMDAEVVKEFRIVGLAWRYSIEVPGEDLISTIMSVLADCYTDAAQALVDWVNEQEDDEDEDDEDDEPCE
jgi:hypothetical protein